MSVAATPNTSLDFISPPPENTHSLLSCGLCQWPKKLSPPCRLALLGLRRSPSPSEAAEWRIADAMARRLTACR
jgi:hypothetical protein